MPCPDRPQRFSPGNGSGQLWSSFSASLPSSSPCPGPVSGSCRRAGCAWRESRPSRCFSWARSSISSGCAGPPGATASPGWIVIPVWGTARRRRSRTASPMMVPILPRAPSGNCIWSGQRGPCPRSASRVPRPAWSTTTVTRFAPASCSCWREPPLWLGRKNIRACSQLSTGAMRQKWDRDFGSTPGSTRRPTPGAHPSC